ncbi:MAG: hypothetical protein PUF65_09315 [Lachnospiraceae bacterium]|nr:hypothetical protein [Lachnospiraceae bacterium]
MKNLMLGIVGIAILWYTVAAGLSIYGIAVRKNEMENHLTCVLKQTVRQCEEGMESENAVAELVENKLRACCSTVSEISVSVLACDMERGELSVKLTETFRLPGGVQKTWICEKTYKK